MLLSNGAISSYLERPNKPNYQKPLYFLQYASPFQKRTEINFKCDPIWTYHISDFDSHMNLANFGFPGIFSDKKSTYLISN